MTPRKITILSMRINCIDFCSGCAGLIDMKKSTVPARSFAMSEYKNDYTKMTKVALNLCFEAHKNQRDKSGMPYVFHPFHLAEQMKDEKTTIVALLHDVVEDTDVTLDDIRNMGFDDEVVAAIELMTHDLNVPYMEYVSRIKKNPISKAVKLADLHHNSDITRLDEVTARDEERLKKYAEAIRLLEEDD